MSDKFDPDLFRLTANSTTGQCRAYYDGERIPRARLGGSRQFFNIHDEFFVKANYGTYGQCESEVLTWLRIEAEDKQYFPELLWACDFKEEYHWSVWRYIELTKYMDDNEPMFRRCEAIVDRLCDKYHIDDVVGCLDWNWYIINDKPIIVDIGCS